MNKQQEEEEGGGDQQQRYADDESHQRSGVFNNITNTNHNQYDNGFYKKQRMHYDSKKQLQAQYQLNNDRSVENEEEEGDIEENAASQQNINGYSSSHHHHQISFQQLQQQQPTQTFNKYKKPAIQHKYQTNTSQSNFPQGRMVDGGGSSSSNVGSYKQRQRAFSQTPADIVTTDGEGGKRKRKRQYSNPRHQTKSSDIMDETSINSHHDDSTSNGTHHQFDYRKLVQGQAFSANAFAQNNIHQGGPSARDMLLIKCKQAIETLHLELEQEREEKVQLFDQIQQYRQMTEDMQAEDIDKNMRLQRLTEEQVVMQSEIVCLAKERERWGLERDECERQVQQFEVLEQDYNNLALEKQDLQDQNRRLQQQVEVLQTERQQTELHLQLLRKDKDELTISLHDIKSQLQSEQRKFESTQKLNSDQLQDLIAREQQRRDQEIQREREERLTAQRDFGNKVQDLQDKHERVLRDRENLASQNLEQRVKEVQSRYESEIERINDTLSKYEQDNYKKAQSLKVLEMDKHSYEIKILELNECLRAEKMAFEMKTEGIQREKDADIIKIGEELNYLKQELTKAEAVNVDLLEDLKQNRTLREKYDDLKAEWMTLRQTNAEYKRTLQEKVRDGFKFQKDFELFKQKNELLINELTMDNDQRLQSLRMLESERDQQKDHICTLESMIAVKDRDFRKLQDMTSDEKEKLQRELRQALEECEVAQNHAKTCENERLDVKRRLAQLEESYKRDTELFRQEAMKRDQDLEDEKVKQESELFRARTQIDQTLEFVVSIRKDLIKLSKQVEKKQLQYYQEEEDENKHINISNANLITHTQSGKKLILTSLTETFRQSVDNLTKRIDSYLYFSTARQQENLLSASEKPGCKTTTTLGENLNSAMKRQISALIGSTTQKRGGQDLISTLGSHHYYMNNKEEKPINVFQEQYSSRY